jgi:RNA recognition motif-containing protein
VRLLTRKGDPNALANLAASKRKSIAKGKAKDPTQPQSKGCAFVEFKSSAALRKGLHFHHTMLEGRKINVELTAGGGGKSDTRQQKIKKKNAGLEKERVKLHGKYVAPQNEARKKARQNGTAADTADATTQRPAKRLKSNDTQVLDQSASARCAPATPLHGNRRQRRSRRTYFIAASSALLLPIDTRPTRRQYSSLCNSALHFSRFIVLV